MKGKGEVNETELLARIDAKLGALLALTVDQHLRSQGMGRAQPRAVELLLHDAGLSTADIATMLGKTQRAVQFTVAPPKRPSGAATKSYTGRRP